MIIGVDSQLSGLGEYGGAWMNMGIVRVFYVNSWPVVQCKCGIALYLLQSR